MFLAIVKDIHKKYKVGPTDRKGRSSIKLELLVIGSLSCSATRCCFNLIKELTCMSDEKHRTFFQDYFSTWDVCASKAHITMPKTKENIRHMMGVYERYGHAGCVGSVDCVHIIWNKYRSGMQAICTGKGKVPTLVFQAACSHTKRILSASNCFLEHATIRII